MTIGLRPIGLAETSAVAPPDRPALGDDAPAAFETMLSQAGDDATGMTGDTTATPPIDWPPVCSPQRFDWVAGSHGSSEIPVHHAAAAAPRGPDQTEFQRHANATTTRSVALDLELSRVAMIDAGDISSIAQRTFHVSGPAGLGRKFEVPGDAGSLQAADDMAPSARDTPQDATRAGPASLSESRVTQFQRAGDETMPVVKPYETGRLATNLSEIQAIELDASGSPADLAGRREATTPPAVNTQIASAFHSLVSSSEVPSSTPASSNAVPQPAQPVVRVLDLVLEPEALGRMSLRLTLGGSGLTLGLAIENEGTRKHVLQDLKQLTEQLGKAGYDGVTISVEQMRPTEPSGARTDPLAEQTGRTPRDDHTGTMFEDRNRGDGEPHRPKSGMRSPTRGALEPEFEREPAADRAGLYV
ncbi:MAG: flagellar hook-length control protein FliK [Hyphomicrobium sp.]|nr:flagellar hook-length control protein FliK [Hyphomicrobium sp.]